MPHCRERDYHIAGVGLLLLSAIAMQGCLAAVWLGAVGIDVARTSDVVFQSFENSWLVAPEERKHLGSVKSVAVMPFAGDSVMAERWAAVIQETTDLRVVRPPAVTRYEISDRRQIGLVQRIGAELHVDCVLIGNVTSQEPMKGFVGLKNSSSQRLYLQLVSAEGILMWKTELPFTMVKGTKGMDEEFVTQALLTHVRSQANELGLAELVATTMQAAPRSLPDTSDIHMASPIPGFDHP